jgi:hypothetical protein
MKGKSASMVSYKEEDVRCIYEIEGSNQKVFVTYPDIKVSVTVFTATDADVKRNLAKVNAFNDKKLKKLNKKGYLFLLSGLHHLGFTEENIKSEFIDMCITDKEHCLTKDGVKYIRNNMPEKLTSIVGGNLALDESQKNCKLVKFIK